MKSPYQMFQMAFILIMLMALRIQFYPFAILMGVASAVAFLFHTMKKK